MSTMFVLLCFVFLAHSQIFVGPKYQAQSSSAKASALGAAITNNTNPGSFPTLGLAELFIESMPVSFDTVADDMPLQFDGFQRRPKLIHSVGASVAASWQPVPNAMKYTGVFMGCENLILRFSTATAPATGPKGYVPALSLKCLRTGVPSANVFGMYSLEGQDSWNFFKHDLTNHVPDISTASSFILRQVRAAFMTASNWPTMLGLTDFATFDENGTTANSPSAPFRIIFHPVTSVRNSFSDSPSSTPFEEVIANGLKPGPLYYVYAQDQPTDTQDKFILVGRIVLTGSATTSNFGDKYMFYQHARMEADFAIHPEWVAAAQQIVKEQQNTNYFTFPDLPFN